MALITIVRCHLTGFLAVWRFALVQADRAGVTSEQRAAMLSMATLGQQTFFERVVAVLADEYERELSRFTRTSEGRSFRLVREILRGASDDVAELGYDLAGVHIAVVGRGEDLDLELRAVAGVYDRRLLAVWREDSLWGWLGGQRELSGEQLAQLSRWQPREGEVIALGEPATGVEGFRRSHEQALAAYRVGLLRGAPVTRYADVSLLAHALEDEDVATSLVRTHLGPIRNGSRGNSLRETLRAYLRTGQNAASAAAMLGVDRRTVNYRLRSIEQALGDSIAARHAELKIALELEQLLPPSG
jgi:hypothetical protein